MLKGWSRLIRACGTCLDSHKVAALERMIDRLGTYLNICNTHIMTIEMKGYM